MTDKQPKKSIHEIAAQYRDNNYAKSVLSKEQIEKLHEARLIQMKINHLEAVEHANTITQPLKTDRPWNLCLELGGITVLRDF